MFFYKMPIPQAERDFDGAKFVFLYQKPFEETKLFPKECSFCMKHFFATIHVYLYEANNGNKLLRFSGEHSHYLTILTMSHMHFQDRASRNISNAMKKLRQEKINIYVYSVINLT